MSEDNKTKRRKVMKTVSSAVVAATGLTAAGSSAQAKSETTISPDEDKVVASRAEATREIEEIESSGCCYSNADCPDGVCGREIGDKIYDDCGGSWTGWYTSGCTCYTITNTCTTGWLWETTWYELEEVDGWVKEG